MTDGVNLRQAQNGDSLTKLIGEKLKSENGGNEVRLSGSVWNQILDIVDEQQQTSGDVYSGGSKRKNWRQNYVLLVGQVVTFTNEVWNRIKSLAGLEDKNTAGSEEAEGLQETASVRKKDEVMLGKIKTLPETPTATPSNVSVDPVLKQNVEKAQKFLLKQLELLDDTDLQKIGITSDKRDRLMEYIKNITFDIGHDSAEARGAGIVFSVDCSNTDKLENMTTLLMHEANHCDENFLGKNPEYSQLGDLRHRDENNNPLEKNLINTKEEEIACETLGLLTTALLIDKGILSDTNYGRYPESTANKHPVLKYLTDANLLKSDVKAWANESYTNYPEGINNAGITIEHLTHQAFTEKYTLSSDVKNEKLELKDGDIIKIGNKLFPLSGKSSGVVLSALDSIPVLQMISCGGDLEHGDNLGIIEFDNVKMSTEEENFYKDQRKDESNHFWYRDTQSTPIVVMRNGSVIAKGTIYNYDSNK